MQDTTEQQRKLIKEAVQETLIGLGFHVHNPSGIQADMIYLRKMRRGSEDMGKIIRSSALALLVTTGLYLLWDAVKHIVRSL